jgi:hypothetical protein
MGLGITETLALAGSLVFALPLAIYALEQVVGGDAAAGGLLLAVALLMVLLPQYLTTPDDLLGTVADGAVGSVLGGPNEDGEPDE